MTPIRTRFAPSPTGYLHVGGVRTALFAWLLAKQNKGKFILRFEDTDKDREVTGAKQHLIDSLHALDLDYDEGPDVGGEYGPYVQSERLDVYRKWANSLIEQGRAYADPYSSEEVQKFRKDAQANKRPFLYRYHRPTNPPTWDGKSPLRFKSDPKSYKWHDEVMGDLSTPSDVIDDFVLIKSDGYPTYNFAHIIDDYEMHITHILRGQEFIASVPNYLNLYEALDISPPIMATLPHIMSEQGNRKLSKRDGAKDVLDYIAQGYPAEALISFIATLGWNDGSSQETYTRQELLSKFSLSRVQKSGAQFDERRLKWVSGTFIRNTPLDVLLSQVENYWPNDPTNHSLDYKKSILGLVQERLKHFDELPDLTKFFFADLPINKELIDTHKQLKKLSPKELKSLLSNALEVIEQSDFSTTSLTNELNNLLENTEQKPVVLFSLIRIAITQSPSSPGLVDTMIVLGKEKVIKRINKQLEAL